SRRSVPRCESNGLAAPAVDRVETCPERLRKGANFAPQIPSVPESDRLPAGSAASTSRQCSGKVLSFFHLPSLSAQYAEKAVSSAWRSANDPMQPEASPISFRL